MDELKKRGSIAFFSTYRPPVPLDIFSWSEEGESPLTDGKSYNYNGQVIPPEALKKLIRRPKLTSQGTEEDVNTGRLTGMIFVSERDDNLETLQIGLRVDDNPPEVFSLADVFGESIFSGVRMEDSGCIAGDFLIYVTTKDPALYRREPWTSVYKTNLKTGETNRLTPPGNADLSPSVSPSGKQIAVASFQAKAGWQGEIEDLQTDIFVMNVEKPFKRRLIVENGGWPTWGSDNVIFFHRKKDKEIFGEGVEEFWGVYRVDISTGDVKRMTPVNFKSMTPAAINDTTVAVATIREKSDFGDERKVDQYRHIEIFDTTRGPEESKRITQNTTPDADHFNPFVIKGSEIIGYHRCNKLIQTRYETLKSPHSDVELFRVSGVFPTFKKDGSKFAYVDNEFKTVWVADKDRVYAVHTESSPNKVFSPVWNQNSEKDTLYFCVGHSFASNEAVQIRHINLSTNKKKCLTSSVNKFNNAFPSTNSDGDKFVFRSKRENGFKNLWIMENAEEGESRGNVATRLTEGEWTDTHCQWSPRGDWIVFSSTRDKPKKGVLDLDFGLDPGYFGIYIVHSKTKAWLRVAASGYDFSGHINHPFFSPDEKSVVVASDLAAVSVDPISLPLFSHSVRPYGDIFTIDINDLKDIDLEDIDENNHITDARFENVKKFTRVTHSRFENSTATWTERPPGDSKAEWHLQLKNGEVSTPGPTCPFLHQDGGGHTWHTSGHLVFKDRCC